jgi:two-component system CheB/CheR fusion protein
MTSPSRSALRLVDGDAVRILLIDDNPHDRVLLERELALRFPGLTVWHVRDAEQLDAALVSGEFDLAITDYRLHWAEGIEVLRRIKARWPERPVIMFTASGTEEIAARAMSEGLDDYITKTAKHFVRMPYVVVTCLDRASQRQALQTASASLRASEERFRHMAEAMPQILYATDAAGKIQYINDRWRDYTGLSGHSTRDYARVIPAEDLKNVEAAWQQAHATGRPLEIEFRLRRHSDGTLRWFLMRALPIHDGGGSGTHLRGWIGTATDIHDQKRAAEELRSADRRKDEFLANLAHELRNPLAPIRNAVQLLYLKDPPDPDIRTARDIINRQAQHLVRLVDDLLDVSRLTLGKVTLRPEPVDVAQLIATAVESARPLLDASGHELTAEIYPQPLRVHVDPTRLSQVLTNLLNNAAKYTPRGGYIVVRASRERGNAVIRVRDNGIGIPPDMLGRVFEPFMQIKSAADAPQDGLGVGLALARRLIDMHGGSISAHSGGNGHGSEFIVHLPLYLADPAADSAAVNAVDNTTDSTTAAAGTAAAGRAAAAQSQPRAQPGLANRRILIVDDNRDGADSLSMLLELLHCTVRTAYDGREAIETARGFAPEAVLLDIGMPRIDGYEVCRLIRQEPWGARAAIIALTGWGQEADRRRTSESGFDAHLVKPVHPDSAVKLLAELIGSRDPGP